MANSTVSTETDECNVFETDEYVTVAIVSSASAFLSSIFCIIVILFIFLLKKHYFFIQRLVLYLSITALVNSLSIVLRLYRIGYKQQSEALQVLCIAAAFIDQTTRWANLMAFTAITFTLLMTVAFHKSTARLEWVYVVLIFIFPVTFNWIPFINETYGQAGAWCWIRSLNYDDNCTEHELGTYLQYVLWYIPAYVLLGILLLVYSYIIVRVCRQRSMIEINDEEATKAVETLNKEVLPLLFYPFGLFILNIFPLVNRIQGTFTAADPIYALWMLHAIFSPIQGGYIAIVYVLDRQTLRRLSFGNVVAFFKRSDVVKEYPAMSEQTTESMTRSHTALMKHTHSHKGAP